MGGGYGKEGPRVGDYWWRIRKVDKDRGRGPVEWASRFGHENFDRVKMNRASRKGSGWSDVSDED